MTGVSLTRRMPEREPPTLNCQRVGGCPARVTVTAIMTVAALVVALLFCVWSRTEGVKQGYAFSELAREIKDQTAAQEELRATAAGLRSPDRIEAIARRDLGMQLPTPEQIRTVEYRSRPGLTAKDGRGKEGAEGE
jgi:cell division protein FtsL